MLLSARTAVCRSRLGLVGGAEFRFLDDGLACRVSTLTVVLVDSGWHLAVGFRRGAEVLGARSSKLSVECRVSMTALSSVDLGPPIDCVIPNGRQASRNRIFSGRAASRADTLGLAQLIIEPV